MHWMFFHGYYRYVTSPSNVGLGRGDGKVYLLNFIYNNKLTSANLFENASYM